MGPVMENELGVPLHLVARNNTTNINQCEESPVLQNLESGQPEVDRLQMNQCQVPYFRQKQVFPNPLFGKIS